MAKPAIDPAQAFRRALAASSAGRLTEAEQLCQQILDRQHDFFDAIFLLAGVQLKLGKNELALANYDRGLRLRPNHVNSLCNRGNALGALKRHGEALASYEKALRLRPDDDVLFNRGNALHQLNRLDEALASYDRALALRPDFTKALTNRGNVWYELKRFDEALSSYDRALAVAPDNPEAHFNRGTVLRELGRLDEALASYQRALGLRPNFTEVRWNLAALQLVKGDFSAGWRSYEWRWKDESKFGAKRNFKKPLWLGAEPIDGKTVLLHSEQGLGDTIQFCRYACLVAAQGARVILEVESPLRELMQSLPGVAQVITMGEPMPDFDFQCPILSLPLAFGTILDTIPSQTPYLSASQDKIQAWRDRMSEHDKLRIGLVWAGNPMTGMPNANRIDRERSIAFDRLAPLFEVTTCEFYSLQKGGDAVAQLRDSPLRPHVIDWSEELHDFSDTAALIENLDLVISVDTSVAHLAGALGKPFWLLNRYSTCWRWLLDRDDSPWYPTARLFRQDDSRDWNSVVARVRDALHRHVQALESQ
jgi:tetratricopeptide (TPR) repeat protein